jgi:hypothetical protein
MEILIRAFLVIFIFNSLGFSNVRKLELKDESLWHISTIVLPHTERVQIIKSELDIPSKRFPNKRDTLLKNFVNVYEILKKYERAKRVALFALQETPKSEFWTNKLSKILKREYISEAPHAYQTVAFQLLEPWLEYGSEIEKGEALYGMSYLYEQLGDIDEAYTLLIKAKRVYPHPEIVARFEALKDKVVLKKSVLQQIKEGTKKTNLNFGIGVNYARDTNVILEEKYPSRPTNKKDDVFTLNFDIKKGWRPLWNVTHSSSFLFNQSKHISHEELNTRSATLAHNFSFKKKAQRGNFNLGSNFSAMHFESSGRRLLRNWSISPSIYYFDGPLRALFYFRPSHQESTYFDSVTTDQGGETQRFAIGANKFFARLIKSINVEYGLTKEAPENTSLRYDENKQELKLNLIPPLKLISSLQTSVSFYKRDYTHIIREDDKFRFAINSTIVKNKFHNFKLSYRFVDNQSNVANRSYQKNAYSMGYTLRF